MRFGLRFCFLLLSIIHGGNLLAPAQNWTGTGKGRGEYLELEFAEWERETLFLEAWMELDDLQQIQPLVSISGINKNVLIASSWRSSDMNGPKALRSSQLAIFSRTNWDDGNPDWVSPLALQAGKWFHLALQISEGACEMWVDGVSIGKLTAVESELIPLLRQKTVKVSLGSTRDRERFLHTFRGGVDELRLWNKQRAVRELRSTLPLRLTAAESGVVLRYSFDEEKSLRGQPSNLVNVTDTLDRSTLSWDNFHQFTAPGNFPSANVSHFDFLKPFVSEERGQSLVLGVGKNSTAFQSVWFSTDRLAPGDWVRTANSDPALKYFGYLGQSSIGVWDMDGGAIQGPIEALVEDVLKQEDLSSGEPYQIERNQPGLPKGFVPALPACRLLDGRWTLSGNLGAFWWDGTRFHPLFPKENQKELAFWVEILPGTFLISNERTWTAFHESDGNSQSWPALEIARDCLDWETDHAGRFWLVLNDQILEIRLNTRGTNSFWQQWTDGRWDPDSDSDLTPRWIAEKVYQQSALDLQWDKERKKLWAVTDAGLVFFNHDEEKTWTAVAQKENRLKGGVKTLVLGEDKNFWVGVSEGLLFFDAQKTDAELYPWPEGFGMAGTGSGRVRLVNVGDKKIWALDGSGNLAFWNQGSWEQIANDLGKSSGLRFFSYNENEVWLAGPGGEWARFFRNESFADDSGAMTSGLVLFEHKSGDGEFPESRESGANPAGGMDRSDFPKITAHVFGDRVKGSFDRVEWNIFRMATDEPGNGGQNELVWASKPSLVQAGSRMDLSWRPDNAGSYTILASLSDEEGTVLDEKAKRLLVAPEWHELGWVQGLVWGVTSLLGVGLVFVFWKGGSAWMVLPKLKTQLNETLNRLSEAQIVAKRELSNSESAQQKLKEKEKDLREIRFELIGRLHEEIRPLLEYVLPDGNLRSASDSKETLDSEFQEKVRESLQFLSDLCLVELDQHDHEGSPVEVEQEWFSLQELLAEMERWFRVSCDHKAIRLKTELVVLGGASKSGANKNFQVLGPFGLLRSVLFNLVSNAIHFTQRGEVTISIRIGKIGSSGSKNRHPHQLQVEVIDTGTGIPVEEIRRITEPGYRGVNSREKWRPGKGTGLFIVRKALDSVGAELSLESEVGKGSRFSFSVGIQAPEELGAEFSTEREEQRSRFDSSFSSQAPANPEEVALWNELQEAIRYAKWREASLVALALKKKNACSMEELNRLGEIMLRQGKEEALEWIRHQRPITE